MGFSTVIFIFVFFPVCIGAFYLARIIEKSGKIKKLRLSDIFLILAGIVFYGWAGLNDFFGILLYVALVFVMGRLIRRGTRSRLIIGICVVILAGILYYFKYYDFMAANIYEFSGIDISIDRTWTMAGISFITFSAISYLIDIYRGDAEKGNLMDVSLYLTFFPKVISGPIVLWKDFSDLAKNRDFSVNNFAEGINRFIIGLCKKVILADSFGAVVVDIQNQTGAGIDTLTAWGCAFLYFLQIYYDFSGYSDMAIGLSKMFGFNLKENFNFPYISTSITEFWRRWHISLGTWFREYLYIPLGGNRKGFNRTLFNLFVVFFVTGIWHGAGWGYLCWGLIHGACIIIERCIKDKTFYKRIPSVAKWLFTMFVVFMGWEFFRLGSFSETVDFFKIMFGIIDFEGVNFTFRYYFSLKIIILMLIAMLGGTILGSNIIQRKAEAFEKSRFGYITKEGVYMVIFVIGILFMVNSTYSPFIYFQY